MPPLGIWPVTRLRRIAVRDRIFFVTTNLASGAARLSARERDAVLEIIDTERTSGAFLLFGYVVMPTHLHLLLYPTQLALPAAMHRIKMRTAHRVAAMRSCKARLWQPQYFDFILRRVRDFWDKLDYIHQNPVEGRLVSTPSAWRWSSYAHYARTGHPAVAVNPIDLPADRNALLWPAPWR